MCDEHMTSVKRVAGRTSCNTATRSTDSLLCLLPSFATMAGTPDATKGSTVLVVSTDPVIGGLLGLLVELEEHRPVYAAGEPSPQAALVRHRPQLVLVDVEHRDGFSPEFLAHAERAGVNVLAFGHRHPAGEVHRRAVECGVPYVLLPIDRATFARTLSEALNATSS